MSNSAQTVWARCKSLFFRLSELEITPIAWSRPWNFRARYSTIVESIPPEKATMEPFLCLNQLSSIESFSFKAGFISVIFISMLATIILFRVT